MRLIGAGLPRTATLSQKVALEMLGVGPCYHMVDVLGDLDRVGVWADAVDGNARWDEIFAGYNSTVDWPGSYFYRELREAYPDAKVLLSVRTGEAWAKSMSETINSILYGDSLMYDLSNARCRIDGAWAGYIALMREMWDRSGLLPRGGDVDAATLARAMERHNDEVRDSIDDVLVWSPGDGWEPICELLDLPIPDAPFPCVNDSSTFEKRIVDSALAALNSWHREAEPTAVG
jgi:sulfotransferase family protein